MVISKEFDFDAAHRLTVLPPEHKCHRLHGHTYRVQIALRGQVGKTGMVADYFELASAWEPLHDSLDHRYLNDILGLGNPTTEVLAQWIFERLVGHFAGCQLRVRVFESATTFCEAGEF